MKVDLLLPLPRKFNASLDCLRFAGIAKKGAALVFAAEPELYECLRREILLKHSDI